MGGGGWRWVLELSFPSQTRVHAPRCKSGAAHRDLSAETDPERTVFGALKVIKEGHLSQGTGPTRAGWP